MTDDTPGGVPAATVCPRRGCHVLLPDTLEDRREHRQGHDHDDKVEEAIRRALRELRGDFDKLRGSVRDDVKAIREEVSGIDRAVGQIEIPEPVAPLTITRGGWDDDEDDDTSGPSDVDEEDWGFATPDPEPAPADLDAPAEPVSPPAPAIDTRPAWAR